MLPPVGIPARVDASGVEQVADQAVHVVGLRVDDPEELAHLGRVQDPRGAQHGRRRPLDRGERRAQLVAHHPQEIGPQPLQLLERCQILHGYTPDLVLSKTTLQATPMRHRGGLGRDQPKYPLAESAR